MKRELTFKEDGQEYAQVIRMLGNGRLEAQCFDGQKRLCHIRGKLRKKVWVNQVRKLLKLNTCFFMKFTVIIYIIFLGRYCIGESQRLSRCKSRCYS